VIGNPPYDNAEAHVRRALSLLAPMGIVAFLLRRNFVGPARFAFLEEDRSHIPIAEHVLGPRVSFTGEGTDMQEYSLFVWGGLGNRGGWVTSILRWRE
jgi:hypothetical protein